MRIIDAHHYVWDLPVRDQDWIAGRRWMSSGVASQSMAGAGARTAIGVTATVLVQTATRDAGSGCESSRWRGIAA